MALSFAKKSTPAGGAVQGSSSAASKPSPQNSSGSKQSGSTPSWLKTGAAAKETFAQAEAQAELAKAQAGKAWRFWCPVGEDRKITFLDGNADEDGLLDTPMFHEHSIVVNGERQTFVCTSEAEGYCPICAMGNDAKSSLVSALTIIDHTPHTVKQGPNAGKVIQHTRKLFVPKKQTIRLLSKIAVKRGGLAGATFDVSRTGDKAASVGDQFDFVEKLSMNALREKYGLDEVGIQPLNLAEEIVYHTGDELLAMGIGKGHGGVGKESGVHEGSSKASLKSQL